ncbi:MULTISPECIES: class I SAM-dependent methyltransferase [Acinetobacter]|uniref:O-methyltransferase involved in polyketide biosynthesis n=1 Tax=Acinetobacter calcoaceticus TaxID=471 RepID=A0ABD5AN96_ACICA|nr:class I SAM-dependent methyltransferase [Acinetobacter calcoaceticus]MBJ9703345.1 class I SAM-dependent methyltransferase [Acinetobacter calcoaceticus]MDP9803964.1 O-methyltransferase involved in polyketide biosynthesis [Acinetobacter calcoaceticus]
MTQQLSKHRHISFTAHYTGYIWYQMGISHEALATAKGKSLAYLVHPIESWAEKYVGGSMRTTLKQRHTMLDHHLEKLIQENPDLQVLEIACGLSPRGWWFRQHYPSITYRELDLPDMAQTKQNALQQIEKNAPEILSVDLFTEAFAQAFEVFDPNRPLVVISEGLINYFDKDLLKQLIQSIAHYGTAFKTFHYLTDLYPEPIKNKLATLIWNSSKLLKLMSRSSFSFHFKSPQEVQDFFKDAGFQQVTVEQPQIFFGQVPSDDHEQHLGDLVWIIHSQTK